MVTPLMNSAMTHPKITSLNIHTVESIMKTFKEFLIKEGKHTNDYKNWGFVTPEGEIIDALLHPIYKDKTIIDHGSLFARLNGKYVDTDGKFGKRHKWYEYDSKTKKVNSEKKVEEDEFSDVFYAKNSGYLRWYISVHDDTLFIDAPDFPVTDKMLQNIIKLTNYSYVKGTTYAFLEMATKKNKKLSETLSEPNQMKLELFRRKIIAFLAGDEE